MYEKGLFIVLVAIFIINHTRGQVVSNDGLGTVYYGASIDSRMGSFETFGLSQKIPTEDSTILEVKINCRNVPGQGLVCSADYPDHCKEQWNFPNPCTQNNIDMNVTKFAHPFDKSKFLMCGQMGKLYVVQCPQYEVFHEGCSQCVGAEAGLTASCEVPLPPTIRNVCTREAILNNKLFFPFPGNLSKFIHCDIWGKPWERICTPGEVWSKWDVTCVLPHLLNPCNRPTTDLTFLYSHPCDPSIYLTCDLQGRAHEVNCLRGEAFHEENQRCQPYADFKGQVLSSFCENYMFGFRQNHGNPGISFGESDMSQRIDGTVSRTANNRGISFQRTSSGIDGSMSVLPNPSGQGSTTTFDLRGGQLNRESNLMGQGDGTASFDRTTRLRGGSVGGTINTDGQGNFKGSLDINRGSVSGGSSGSIGQENLGESSSTNFIDIRGKSLSTDPKTAEFVDIRNKGTGGTSTNMIDIRGEKGRGSSGMLDIRTGASNAGLQISGSKTDTSGRMVDIRDQGTNAADRNMVDIRNSQVDSTRGMTDIRNFNPSKNMVDIRGRSIGGNNMIDIRGSGTDMSGGMVDIRNIGSGPSGNGMIDIRGSATPGTQDMVDIRGTGMGSIGDLGGMSGTGLSDGMVDIRNQGSAGSSMFDIRGRSASGTSNMVDIRGSGKSGVTGDLTSTGTDLSGGMIDIRGTGTGSSGVGMVDIRGGSASGTKDMVDIRGTGMGSNGDMRGTSGPGLSDGTVDIRNQGSSGSSMFDIRGGSASGTTKMIDIRGSGKTGVTGDLSSAGTDLSGGMIDIRGTGTGSGGAGMVDIRGGSASGTKDMVDIRGTGMASNGDMRGTSGTGLSDGMMDIRNQGSSGSSMFDIRGGSASGTSKMIDIRGSRSNGVTGDQSSTGTDLSGGITDMRSTDAGSSGASMIDIRGGSLSESKDMVDIRGFGSGSTGDIGSSSGTDLSGGMTDIRNQGLSSISTLDIRGGSASGKSNMVDIRGAGPGDAFGDLSSTSTDLTGGMADIRSTGSGSSGASMVDIRGRSASRTKDMVDIRETGTGSLVGDVSSTGTDLTGGMIDIRRLGIGSGNKGMIDIQGGSVSGSKDMIDIRRVGTRSGGNMGSSLGEGLSDRMVDIRNQGSSGSSMSDIRGGSGTSNMLDIRGSSGVAGDLSSTGTDLSGGMIDIRGTSTGSGGADLVDIRGESLSGSKDMIDIRGVGTGNVGDMGSSSGKDLSGSMVDIRKQNSLGAGMMDIRSGSMSGTKDMIDIRNSGMGTTGDIGASFTGDMVDIRNQGSSGSGMLDVRGGLLSGTNKMVDIRRESGTIGDQSSARGDLTGSLFDIRGTGSGSSSELRDIRGSGSDITGSMVDIRGTGSGSDRSGMIDIRGGSASGTENMVDIGTGGMDGNFVDIRGSGTDLSSGMGDISGTGSGSSGSGMVDIRGRQASGTKRTVDIRGAGTGGMTGESTTTDLSGGMFDIRDAGTGSANMIDIRQRTGGTQSGTSNGILTDNTGKKSGLSGLSSFDIRNQLGLNGQSGTNTIDRSGTIRTDSVSFEGSIQGGRQGSGTMQDLLNTWNQIIETGSSSSTSRRQESNWQTGSNQGGNRRIMNDLFTVHPSRLKMYDYSDIPFSEPCTQINLDEGRTHFRYRGHPHMFLQCDTSGRMHRMPCSSTGQDYFDPYTNTCVDGPVHVDNRIQ